MQSITERVFLCYGRLLVIVKSKVVIFLIYNHCKERITNSSFLLTIFNNYTYGESIKFLVTKVIYIFETKNFCRFFFQKLTFILISLEKKLFNKSMKNVLETLTVDPKYSIINSTKVKASCTKYVDKKHSFVSSYFDYLFFNYKLYNY